MALSIKSAKADKTVSVQARVKQWTNLIQTTFSSFFRRGVVSNKNNHMIMIVIIRKRKTRIILQERIGAYTDNIHLIIFTLIKY